MAYKADIDPKQNPVVIDDQENYADSRIFHDFLQDLKPKIFHDALNRSAWELEAELAYNARYSTPEPDSGLPWPGASRVVVPIEDMLINKIKPGLIGLVANQSPVVSFEPLLGGKQWENYKNAEYTLDHVIKDRDPNLLHEFIRACDSTLTYGWSILHPYYLYRTEIQRLCIHKDRLPELLSQFVILPQRANEEQAAMLTQAAQGKKIFFTKRMFDQASKQIRELVKQAWHLFDENVTDKEAIDEIMRFLRSDEKIVDCVVRSETANTSTFCQIDGFDFFVPVFTNNLQNASRITVRMSLSENELRRRIRDEAWDKKAVEESANGGGDKQGQSYFLNRNIDNIRSEREGISNLSREGAHEVFATYCWSNFFSKKEKSRGIVVWSPRTERPLKVRPLPYNHGQWPFVQIPYEMNDERFYSPRGIPRMVRDLSMELTYQERAVLNNSMIVNNPTFMYEESTGLDPSTHPWAPGSFMKVGRVDRVAPLQAMDRQINFERHSQILRGMIEQYAGSPDLALNETGAPSQNPRTATEIELIQQLSQVSLGFHSALVQSKMKEVWHQVWSNWVQWGPDEYTVRTSGGTPIRLTKHDIMGQFELIPKGTAGNVNPALEAKKALQRLSVAVQVKPLLDADPKARFDLDIPELVRDYMSKEDWVITKRVFRQRTPQEQEQIIAQRQHQAKMAQGIESGQVPVPLEAFQRKLDTAERNAPKGAAQSVSF